jgi:hypothetical protein
MMMEFSPDEFADEPNWVDEVGTIDIYIGSSPKSVLKEKG